MKNQPDETPITSKEYFALMRLLQTLEDEKHPVLFGGPNVAYSDGVKIDWQTIYDKLNAQCYNTNKQERRKV